jgi:hypothetical protein
MRALVSLLAATLWSSAMAATSSTAFFVSFNASATVVFESTVQLHFAEARDCWRQQKMPGPKTIAREIRGMVSATDRFWQGDMMAPYRLTAVMVSESGGNTRNTSKPNEPSYGPWCGTVDEARESTRIFPDIGCPRHTTDIIERLQSDPEWAAMVAAATLYRYDRAQRGDQMYGLLMYKFGVTGLGRAIRNLQGLDANAPVSNLKVWKHFDGCLSWILCLRARVLMRSTPPCGCLAPPSL